MTRRRTRVKKQFNANTSIRPSVTEELIQRIRDLPEDGYKYTYLKACFLSKYCSTETAPPLVRRNRAIMKWLATERDNEATNTRLMNTHQDYHILPGVEFGPFVEWCQSFIERIIGATPDTEALIGQFSGGATTSRKRTESQMASKFLGKADVTPRARSIFESLLGNEDGSDPDRPGEFAPLVGWGSYRSLLEMREVEGNVLFTVPKNADIDRVCCKEPDINMFLQKGLGSAISKSLQREGINLNDQSINFNLAREGSITGNLATIDLSSASDSVSYEVVALLLPPVWFTYLDATRSPKTFVDGVEHSNEMFSSMGNGFTFELESLLFYVLARATAYFRGVKGVISVYGDDIICPTRLAHDLTWVLSYFGFTVNSAKSFWEGPFRESCGGHFVNGRDVTPFYLRKPIKNLTDLIHIGNAIRKWSETDMGINDCYAWDLWSWVRDQIPKSLWGGREYSSITQLVSPHHSRGVLVPRKVKDKEIFCNEKGLLCWLSITWRRSSDKGAFPYMTREDSIFDPFEGTIGIETSSYTREFPKFRVKPWKGIVTQLRGNFLEEIASTPSSTTEDSV